MITALILSMCFMFVCCMAALAVAFFLPGKIMKGMQSILLPGSAQNESIRKELAKMGLLKEDENPDMPVIEHPSPLAGYDIPFINEELLREQQEEESEIMAEVAAAEEIRLQEEYPSSDNDYAEFLDKTSL